MKKVLFIIALVALIFYLKPGVFVDLPSSFSLDYVRDEYSKITDKFFRLSFVQEFSRFIKNKIYILINEVRLGTASTTTIILPRDAQTVLKPIQKIADQVIAPPPIEQAPTEATTTLSRLGVIHRTNTERILQNLKPLRENMALNRAAQIKADDLFAKQYFAHVSPTGQGIATIVSGQGYEYAIVGENLALGRFDDDTALVNAWMASPGHRENIVNPRYEELGAAVKKGIFEGLETWVAVQVFALPLSSCPEPDLNLHATINAKKILLNELESQASVLKKTIDGLRQSDPSYNAKVNEYNSLVPQINGLIEELDTLIKKYNEQVKLLNSCIS